jgi:phosphoribosylanthranilate isomerase
VAEDGRLFPDPARYKGVAKAFLADTYKRYGSVILAGGLSPNNIYQALSVTQPWGVDVSSVVETKGYKDSSKIKNLYKK